MHPAAPAIHAVRHPRLVADEQAALEDGRSTDVHHGATTEASRPVPVKGTSFEQAARSEDERATAVQVRSISREDAVVKDDRGVGHEDAAAVSVVAPCTPRDRDAFEDDVSAAGQYPHGVAGAPAIDHKGPGIGGIPPESERARDRLERQPLVIRTGCQLDDRAGRHTVDGRLDRRVRTGHGHGARQAVIGEQQHAGEDGEGAYWSRTHAT